jgi:hypothetical protein
MQDINSRQSVSTQVNRVIQSHIEIRGEKWLTSLGYGPSNDYCQSVANIVTALTGTYVRFETVARYIRKTKAQLRAKQRLLNQ